MKKEVLLNLYTENSDVKSGDIEIIGEHPEILKAYYILGTAVSQVIGIDSKTLFELCNKMSTSGLIKEKLKEISNVKCWS